MRHFDIAKEAQQMITERVGMITSVEIKSEELALQTSDPGLAAGIRQAGKNRVAELRDEQKLLQEIGEEKAKESIQNLPGHEQAEAHKKVMEVFKEGDDGSKNFWKSDPELRAELSDALAARMTAPEPVLERQEEPDPAPAQGLTLEEGHAVARDSLDQAVEAHATPSVEPEALPSFDPSHDIERGIEQEQSWAEPPKDIEPEKDER